MTESDAKADLRLYLQDARDALLWKLEGLSEYDIRRPMTPTGTNLLGLVKHLTGAEAAYFGETFGRSAVRAQLVHDSVHGAGVEQHERVEDQVEGVFSRSGRISRRPGHATADGFLSGMPEPPGSGYLPLGQPTRPPNQCRAWRNARQFHAVRTAGRRWGRRHRLSAAAPSARLLPGVGPESLPQDRAAIKLIPRASGAVGTTPSLRREQ